MDFNRFYQIFFLNNINSKLHHKSNFHPKDFIFSHSFPLSLLYFQFFFFSSLNIICILHPKGKIKSSFRFYFFSLSFPTFLKYTFCTYFFPFEFQVILIFSYILVSQIGIVRFQLFALSVIFILFYYYYQKGANAQLSILISLEEDIPIQSRVTCLSTPLGASQEHESQNQYHN